MQCWYYAPGFNQIINRLTGPDCDRTEAFLFKDLTLTAAANGWGICFHYLNLRQIPKGFSQCVCISVDILGVTYQHMHQQRSLGV